jgi:hypothetical protein
MESIPLLQQIAPDREEESDDSSRHISAQSVLRVISRVRPLSKNEPKTPMSGCQQIRKTLMNGDVTGWIDTKEFIESAGEGLRGYERAIIGVASIFE